MKKIYALLCAIALCGCDDPSSKELNFPAMPQELIGCKVFNISNGHNEIQVMRCPNSTTTSLTSQKQVGKQIQTHTSVMIDGVEYQKK